MNKNFLVLALALSVMPVAALAQDTNAPPQLTPDQRQALHQTMQQFGQQEEQLHQQMRYQILSALSPVHRRVVAATIGELAISPNPDIATAAKRLDATLSGGEQQRILAAHATFESQSRQLRDQLKSTLQSEMPAGHSNWMNHGPQNGMRPQHPQFDAGTLVLMSLTPHSHMMGMGWHGDGMHGEGVPPQ